MAISLALGSIRNGGLILNFEIIAVGIAIGSISVKYFTSGTYVWILNVPDMWAFVMISFKCSIVTGGVVDSSYVTYF